MRLICLNSREGSFPKWHSKLKTLHIIAQALISVKIPHSPRVLSRCNIRSEKSLAMRDAGGQTLQKMLQELGDIRTCWVGISISRIVLTYRLLHDVPFLYRLLMSWQLTSQTMKSRYYHYIFILNITVWSILLTLDISMHSPDWRPIFNAVTNCVTMYYAHACLILRHLSYSSTAFLHVRSLSRLYQLSALHLTMTNLSTKHSR